MAALLKEGPPDQQINRPDNEISDKLKELIYRLLTKKKGESHTQIAMADDTFANQILEELAEIDGTECPVEKVKTEVFDLDKLFNSV